MSYPCKPSVFAENPYDDSMFDRDFMHSPDGVREFPEHHCKKTFLVSQPFIKQYGNAIDVGCRDGEYARYLQKHFKHTYCFDPRLRLRTFPYNVDLKKVTHFNCALGDEQTEIVMFGGTHDPRHGRENRVPCFRLDDFGLVDIDYIKIDVEGFEAKVLAGAEQLIARDRPLVVIEQNEATLEGAAPDAAKRWLEARGYRHVATCPRGWDYVMQHESAAAPGPVIPEDRDAPVDTSRLIRIGPLYFSKRERHFLEFGDQVADYQRPGREAALRYVKDWRCALDIGANVGIFARHFAERFERVIAIDPLRENIDCLRLNTPANVALLRVAVGDRDGPTRIYMGRKSLGNSFVADHDEVEWRSVERRDDDALVDARMVRVDDLGLEALGLVKLDVEGSEIIALKGAEKTLRRFRPVVLIEEKPLPGSGGSTAHVEQAAALLKAFGMTAKEKAGADRVYVFE